MSSIALYLVDATNKEINWRRAPLRFSFFLHIFYFRRLRCKKYLNDWLGRGLALNKFVFILGCLFKLLITGRLSTAKNQENQSEKQRKEIIYPIYIPIYTPYHVYMAKKKMKLDKNTKIGKISRFAFYIFFVVCMGLAKRTKTS